MSPETERILAELRAIRATLDAITAKEDIIITREEAARQLKVSTRHLRKLVASGRIVAQPSGFYRGEVERFAKTPQAPLPKMMNKAQRERTASEEAERGRALLKTMRRPRAR